MTGGNDKTIIFLIGLVLAVAAVMGVGAALYFYFRTKRILTRLNHILEDAIAGDFNEKTFDESRISQIEIKMRRFLTLGKLTGNSIEKERDSIKSLVSDISHQTKTPVANILMYSQLLLEQEGLDPESGELSGQIKIQVEKLNFLIGALIKASRLENGIVKVFPIRQETSLLIAEAVGASLPWAEAKRISLSVKENAGYSALFDLRWTAEALENILDNAVKYTPAGGSIAVSVIGYEMFVRIDISDTGPGIAEEDYPRLFERFWRSPQVSAVAGNGIGLYLTREIIAMQNGYITVSSQPAAGTTFSVFLPV